MKNSLSLASHFLIVGSALVVPLVLAGCGRSDQTATNDANSAQTNVEVSPAPVTNSTTATENSSLTPNAPASGPSSGVPDPNQSSKNDTNVGPAPSSVTTPGSETSKVDTNAAPSSTSGGAPSEKSK